VKNRFKNKFIVPDLVLQEREGGYDKGRDVYEQILKSALDLLIDQGYRAVSMRRVAAASGVKLGNLTYYFPTKEDLVRELLNAVISSYEIEFDAIVHEEDTTAIHRLEEICVLILEDIGTKKTTRFFPELWALSNHDEFVLERIQELYARARHPMVQLISEINPALSAAQCETTALFMSASMEGMTIFAGFEKPFADQMPWLERLTIKSFIDLIISMTPEDLP
jgi:AcrR family transcriptional regulator